MDKDFSIGTGIRNPCGRAALLKPIHRPKQQTRADVASGQQQTSRTPFLDHPR